MSRLRFRGGVVVFSVAAVCATIAAVVYDKWSVAVSLYALATVVLLLVIANQAQRDFVQTGQSDRRAPATIRELVSRLRGALPDSGRQRD